MFETKRNPMKEWKEIWRYLKGNRRGKEANRLERAALKDPFLYEALEGLAGVEGDHENIVAGLRHRLYRSPRVRFYWWGIAASFLLTGGIALWLMQQPDPVGKNSWAEVEKKNVEKEELEIPQQPVVVVEETTPLAAMPAVQSKAQQKTAQVQILEDEMDYGAEEETYQQAEGTANGVNVYKELNPVKMVRGIVVDTAGQPLVGVALRGSDLRGGTVSDQEGHFLLQMTDTVRYIMAEYIGMKTQLVPVEGSDPVYVVMTESPVALGETAVVAYGVSRRTKNTQYTNHGQTAKREKLLAEDRAKERFERYVTDSLRYPVRALEKQIEGTVVLGVRFNRKGHPSRIKVLEKLSPECDKEAVRLVEEYQGGWWGQPKNGMVIRISFQLPQRP